MFTKWLVTLAIFTAACTPAQAGLIVEVLDAEIIAGQVGYVDVLISSTGTDSIFSFGYEFQITGNPTNGMLKFRPVQLATEQGGSDTHDYLLLSDVAEENFDTSVSVDGQNLIGSDFASVDETDLTGTRLLARLEIEHILIGDESAEVGNTFTIALINTPAPDPGLGGTTYFSDIAGDNAFYSTGSGTITIVATPEPATVTLLGSAIAIFWGQRKLRLRRQPK